MRKILLITFYSILCTGCYDSIFDFKIPKMDIVHVHASLLDLSYYFPEATLI